jgi:hypothetical protein
MEVFSSAIVATGLDEEMANKLRFVLMSQFGDANTRGFKFAVVQLDDEPKISVIAMDKSKESDPHFVRFISLHDVKFWCDGYLAAWGRGDN